MSNGSQQQQFLEDLATEYKFYGDTRTAFLGRFAPENAGKANKDLKLTWQKDLLTPEQKIQDELKKIYPVLRENGCDIPETQRGRSPKGESPWQLAYKWLWDVKFPEWQKKHQPTATLVEEILSRLDPTNPQLSAAEWGKIAQLMLADRLALTSNPLTNRKGIALNRSDIYVPLGLVERRKPEQVSKQDPQREEEKITPISEDDFFQQVLQQGNSPQSQGRRIAIIGEAGSGKTTRLQKIADWILQQDLGLPIWIPLAELKEQTLIDYLEEKWLKAARVEGATASLKEQKERLWLLLDGLDEMTARVEGRHLSKLLIGWIQSARVIITCRVNVWEADANAFSGFDVFKNLPLDVKQVESFIRRFFQ